jgi:hypothetical protein
MVCDSVYILSEPMFKRTYRSLLPPAHTGFSLADFSTLKMEVIRSPETLADTGSTQHNIPEDGILHTIKLIIPYIVLGL